ncbi:MAG: Glu-tRNA(Gln) amidotransferase subunit GatE [Candidatus Woesearchaeota archaeon]
MDYEDLGLMIGLEIHQQLNTTKLFCSCSSKYNEENKDFDLKVKRKLNSVEGEMGKVDKAAIFEKSKDKDYIYHFYENNCCLVEIDEEPPHKPSKDVLNIGFGVSKALNIDIFDEIQVMRKTVLDGSNTSGFQRTMLLGKDGWFELEFRDNKKDIEVESICLEEDSSKIVKKTNDESIYDLRRLGIPLIEIATAPTITHPQEAKIAAETLGLILRSFNVKRGLGTIRQDINISINGGSRVEIKGAQDLNNLDKYVENEIQRQITLNKVRNKVQARIEKIELKKSMKHIELKETFEKTDSKILSNILKKNHSSVYGIKVPKFDGLLGIKTQPEKRVGTEISDFAKQSGIKGMFHSDEDLEKYGISKNEIKKVKELLNVKKGDAFIIIAENKEILDKATPLIKERILKLYEGVLSEVRKANLDFTNKFLRPMPGKDRMYPETDILPIKPYDVNLPKLLPELIGEYIDLGLSEEQAKNVAKMSPELFESLIQLAKPTFVFEKLINVSKEYDLKNKVIRENLKDVFMMFKKGKITKSGIDKIISFIISDNIKKEINDRDLIKLEGKELEKKVKKMVEEFKKKLKNKKAIFGKVMTEAKYFGNPQEVIKILKKEL